MRTTHRPKWQPVRHLPHGSALWLVLLVIVMVIVSIVALWPMTQSVAQPIASTATGVLPAENRTRQLYALNEVLYPSDAISAVSSERTQRLYALNEQLYPTTVAVARTAQTQRLLTLNEMLYPSAADVSAVRMQHDQRLLDLNERFYPSSVDAPTFWTGRPH